MSTLKIFLGWAFVVCGFVVLVHHLLETKTAGTLSTKAQTEHHETSRDSAIQAAQLDTARAHRATTSAQASYAAGQRAEANAAKFHPRHVRIPHRSLPPGADSSAAVVDSLTRILSAP